jgi:predicted metal-dependent HD superfamily phosphohydrolase
MLNKWLELAEQIGISTYEAMKTFVVLDFFYKDRPYHNWKHIEFCVNEWEKMVRNSHLPKDKPFAFMILVAFFFHDAIYQIDRNDNEKRSAELFVSFLKSERARERPEPWMTPIFSADKLILATKLNVTNLNPEQELFRDTDWSILGQNWDTFCEYDRIVEEEFTKYFGVENKKFCIGRLKFFKDTLKHRIFSSSYFFKHYEKQARENINRMIDIYQCRILELNRLQGI